MAESPSRRAIGTLATAAPSNTSASVRMLNSSFEWSITRARGGVAILEMSPEADRGTRLRPPGYLTWIRWRSGSQEGVTDETALHGDDRRSAGGARRARRARRRGGGG